MRAMIGLGSNVGDRLSYLRAAVGAVASGAIPGTRLRETSRIYETRPVGRREHLAPLPVPSGPSFPGIY